MTLQEQVRKLGEESKYREQGDLFLKETGTTLDVTEAVPQTAPIWAKDEQYKHGIKYACTIKNARGTYAFSFWGSIADAEKVAGATNNKAKVREAVKPDAYSVLACLKDDAGDSFADFCANYGYDTDSISAERTYHAVLEQERNMRRLFTHEELEALQGIS